MFGLNLPHLTETYFWRFARFPLRKLTTKVGRHRMRWEDNNEGREGNKIKKGSDHGLYHGTNPEFAREERYKTDHKNKQPNSHDEIQTGFLSYTCQGFTLTYTKHLLYVPVVLLKELAYIKNDITIRNNRIR